MITFTLKLINLFLLYRFVLGCEVRKTRGPIVIGILLIVADYALRIVFDGYIENWYLIITSILSVIIPVFFFEGKIWTVLGISGVAYEVADVIYSLAYAIIIIACEGNVEAVDGVKLSIYVQLVWLVATLIILKSFGKKEKVLWKHIEKIKPMIFIALSILLYVVRIDWGYFGSPDIDTVVIIQCKNMAKDTLTALLILVVVIAFLIIIQQRKLLKREIILKERCIQEQTDQYVFMGNANSESRKFRHDFNRHVDVMSRLYNNGRIDELGAYINKLGEVKEQFYYVSTGNVVSDAITNQYYVKCKDAGIKLKIIGVFPADISVEMTDLCVIMSNALDNAYEATCKCTGDREISCKIGNTKDLIFITIENPVSEPPVFENGKPKTTKDGKNHGYGTINMIEAAQRSGGSVNWDYENDQILATKICIKGNVL